MRRVVVLLLGACVVAGCGSRRDAAQSPRAAALPPPTTDSALQPASAELGPRRAPPLGTEPSARSTSTAAAPAGPCFMHVPGTTIGIAQLEDGGALVFTTTRDVVELRRRVTETAARHRDDGLRRARWRLDNVDHGIRIVFVAPSAGDVAALHHALREYAQRFARSCAMAVTEPTTPEQTEAESTSSAAPESTVDDTHDDKSGSDPAPDSQPPPSSDEGKTDGVEEPPSSDAGAAPKIDETPKPEEPKDQAPEDEGEDEEPVVLQD